MIVRAGQLVHNKKGAEMLKPTTQVATLFAQNYPIRTEVIAIDDEDLMVRGRITAITEEGVTITCGGLKSDTIKWPNLRFIAHDGFPVREYNGPHRLNTEQELQDLRTKLSRMESKLSGRSEIDEIPRSYSRKYSVGFGDPFELDCSVCSAYLGNSGLIYADSFEAEVLLCSSFDGAFGMLWDFESIFELCDA